MHASQRGARHLVSSNVFARDTVCRSCLHRLATSNIRRHASTASAVAPDDSSSPSQLDASIPPVTASGPRKAFRVMCSPVISRPPLLTRDLTPFEKAYYLYQKRLNERLALPFTRYFYYKKGTPGDVEWKRKMRVRKTAARDVGIYNAYAEDGWNDEVLVGSKLQEPDDIVDKLIRDAEGKDIIDAKPQGDADKDGLAISGDAKVGEGSSSALEPIVIEKPMPRVTEADQKNDVRSLNRKLDRNLYLLVKSRDGRWGFPQDRLYGRENLHQAAERIILQAGGINMNTWVVGNHPVGHFQHPFQSSILSKIAPNRLVDAAATEREQEEFGEKVFFMKARIMTGQADMAKNEFGDQEFQWLAKEEVEKKVTPGYWSAIRNMLTER